MVNFRQFRSALLLAALFVTAAPAIAATGAMSLVPADAVTVGVVKFDELRSSPLMGTLFQHTDRFGGNGEADDFLREAGLEPAKDIDLLVVTTSPRTNLGSEADVLVMAEGRFDVERLTKAITARGAVRKTVPGGSYLTIPEKKDGHAGAISFAGSGLALMGTEAAVTEALATRAKGGSAFSGASGLGLDAARIDPKATAWAVIDVARASRLAGPARIGGGPQGEVIAAAAKNVSTVALWATDTGDALKLGAFGLTTDAETLQLLEDTLRGALSAMRLAVKDKAPDMVSVLRRFDVDRTNDSVRVTGAIPADALKKLIATGGKHGSH